MVQFEKYEDFNNALRVLCGRSLQKVVTWFYLYDAIFLIWLFLWLCESNDLFLCPTFEQQGSRLRADYEVTWTKDSLFRNSSTQSKGKSERMSEGPYRNEAHGRTRRYGSQFTSDDTPRKRFKVSNLVINVTNRRNLVLWMLLMLFVSIFI